MYWGVVGGGGGRGASSLGSGGGEGGDEVPVEVHRLKQRKEVGVVRPGGKQ